MFLMSSFDLESLINVPTRVTTSSSSCIDHFFARLKSNDLSCLIPSVKDLKISDHHLIELAFKISKVPSPQPTLLPGCNRTLNQALLSELFVNLDWSHVYSLDDPALALNQLLTTISTILVQCYIYTPLKKNKLLQPWISRELAHRINNRNKLHKKLKKHMDNVILRNTYDSCCKQINCDIKWEKERYYAKRFSVSRGDVKKNWDLVNEILTKKQKSTSINAILAENGQLLTRDSDIANELNCYFTSVANKLGKTWFSVNNTSGNYELPCDYCANSFFMTPVSSSEIMSIIDSLEPKKTPDKDGLSNFILKIISKYISSPLAHIFNLSFEKGLVPERLKSATIIPIFKKGNRSDRGNYRPIALQPVLLKVLEKAVKNRVTIFLDKFKILSAHQHGFRQGMSTESALMDYLNTIHNGVNRGDHCGGLFVDAAKAFDMVDHKILLSILFKIGFRGVANRWFFSYLNNRTVRVKVNDTFSDSQVVDIGVPQGSVLGPLLFLIYTNSVFKLNLNGYCTGFADDLALAYTGKSPNGLISLINSDLLALHFWFEKHRLILSDKTKFMLYRISGINTVQSLNQVTYHCFSKCNLVKCHNNCFSIDLVSSYKYLGVHLDSSLNWKIHISELKSYLASASRVFYLLRDLCPFSVLKMIYHALVMAKLEYGLTLWGGCYPTTLKPLCIQQKMILRTILKKTRTEPSWPLFKSNNILPLQHLYVFKVLRVFFRRSGEHSIRTDARYNFRRNHQLQFNIPRFFNDHFRRYITVAAPTFFNALPVIIRMDVYSKFFLSKVKKWLFDTSDITYLFRVIT